MHQRRSRKMKQNTRSADPKEVSFAYMEFLIFHKMNNAVITILKKTPSTINILNDAGQTLLFAATRHCNLEIMSYLIGLGCDVNASDTFGWTPLMIAVNCINSYRSTELLLRANADVLATNYAGQSALQIYLQCHMKPYQPVLDLMLERVKSKSTSNEDLLAILTGAGCRLDILVHLHDAEVTRLFLEQQTLNNSNVSIFSVCNCVESFDEKNLRVLLEYGLGVEERRMFFFDYFVHRREIAERKMTNVFVDLLTKSEFLEQHLLKSVDLLFLSATQESLRDIVKSDLNSYVKSKFDYEPIAYLFGNLQPDIVELIEELKIDGNVRGREGKTALHIAVKYNNCENVMYLLKMGIDPNIIDDYGQTPIFYAFDTADEEDPKKEHSVRALLEYGADLQACDADGRIFIEYLEEIDDGDFDDDEIADVFGIILAHFAILQSSNVPIKDSFFECINSDETNFFNSMCEQLEIMKSHKLCGSLTLFTVLTNSDEFVSHRIKSLDPNFIDIITNSDHYELFSYYFHYTDIIIKRILRAYSICIHRRKAITVICDCIESLKNYYVVVDKICSYLVAVDLCKIVCGESS